MQDHKYPTQPVDPLLREAFQIIKQTPLRYHQDRQQGMQNFVTDLDEMFSASNLDVELISSRPKFNLKIFKEEFRLMIFKTHRLFTALSAVLIACVFLFGGVGMTAYAAQSALPGDGLYSVKTGLEATRVRLAKDQVKQIELYLSFAELRLDEISALIQTGRTMDIPKATAEFETYLAKALTALQQLGQNDPVRAAEFNFQVTDTLSRFNQILSGMLSSVPASLQNALFSAIDASAMLSDEDINDDNASLNDDQDDDSLDDDQDDDSLEDDLDDDSLDDDPDDEILNDDQDDNSQDDDQDDDSQDDDQDDDGQDDDQDDDSLDDDDQDDDSQDVQDDDSQDDDQEDDDDNDDDDDGDD